MDISAKLTEEFNLKPEHVHNVLTLLDEGNTIPFIARYRKEMTGAIDDQVLRNLNDRYEYLKNLEKRKEEVAKAITEQEKMTDEIQSAIDAAQTMTEVEDIYRPFKQKKKTRASVAIAKGLQPLADYILAQEGDPWAEAEKYISEENGVETAQQAVDGAKDIIAEMVSDNAELRKKLRALMENHGEIQVKLVKDDGKAHTICTPTIASLYPK